MTVLTVLVLMRVRLARTMQVRALATPMLMVRHTWFRQIRQKAPILSSSDGIPGFDIPSNILSLCVH